MKNSNVSNLLIFSAELSRLSIAENSANTESLTKAMKEQGILYETTIGLFDGHRETSFLAADTQALRDLLATLPGTKDQECFLAIDRHSNGYFESLDAQVFRYVGTFTQVSRWHAEKQLGFTYFPQTDTYWILK